MNSADERLRAASRTAADMFPHGGDLPPLRPKLARGRRTRIGHASRAALDGRRGMRAWATPLAAAGAVMAVVSAFVVPHVIASSTGHPKPANHGPATASAAARHEQRRLDALVVLAVAPATGLQFDRGGKLVWMLHDQYLRGTAGCMARHGYHISDKLAPYVLGDFADNTQMPDLPRIARTHEFVTSGGTDGPSFSRAEVKAASNCPPDSAAYRPFLTAYQAIDGAWWKVISKAEASARVKAALPALQACATRYGFPDNPYGPPAGPITTFPDFMDWVSGFLDGAASRGASGTAMQSLERHWTKVFVTCATPAVGIYQRTLLSAQPGFLHQHAKQIARLDKLAWRYLVARRR
jgi:hypothetical protein